MVLRLLLAAVIAALLGVGAVLVLMVPFLGPFTVGLLLAVICGVTGDLFAPYCKNSADVEFGFAWITIHSTQVYFVYWAMFSTVLFAAFAILLLAKSASRTSAPK